MNEPAGGSTLYAGTANGIYAYADTLPWLQFPETAGTRFFSLAPDPDRGFLYAIGKPGAESFYADPVPGVNSTQYNLNTGSLYRMDLGDGSLVILPTPINVNDVTLCGDGVVLASANARGNAGTGTVYRFTPGSATPAVIYPGDFNGTSWPLYAIEGRAGSSTVYLLRNSTTMADVLISQNNAACGNTWARDPVAGNQIYYQNNPNQTNNLGGGKFAILGYDSAGNSLFGSSNGRVFSRSTGSWQSMGTITPNYCLGSFGSDLSGRTYAALRKYNWDTSNGDEQHGGLFYYSAGSWIRDARFDTVTSRVLTILPHDGQDWVAFDAAGLRRLPPGGGGPGAEAGDGIAAVDLSGVALDPRGGDRAVAFGPGGLYERRDGVWRHLLVGVATDNQGVPLANDPLQVTRERGFLCAGFSPSDPGVIWVGGYTTGLFRAERTAPESWEYTWKRVYWDTLGGGIINDVLVDPFDSSTVWWATGGRGAFLSQNEGATSTVLTDPIPVRALAHDLLEPSERTLLAGLIAGPISQYLPALLSGNGRQDFNYTTLYQGGNVESLQFHPLALGDNSRALAGQQGSWDREMALIQDVGGPWHYDSTVGDPVGLPGIPHFASLRMPLGYDGDEYPDAFTAVRTEGTVPVLGLFHSIADTAGGSPGRIWLDMDPDGDLDALGPTSVVVHPRDGNLLWVTTHSGSAYTLAGAHVTDTVPPVIPNAMGLQVLEANSSAIRFFWLAPGDDGDLPGWASRYQLYYRTDYPISGTPDLAGAYSLSLPAPQIAHHAESFALDISSHAGSDFFSIALRAFDEQGNASNLLVADVNLGVAVSNHAPVAGDDTLTLQEDSTATVDVTANDEDQDPDLLTVIRVTAASHGWSWIGQAGQVNYEPLPDYFGTDSFGYTVVDGHGGSDSATVLITVSAVNDPPVAVDDCVTTTEDVAYKSIFPVQNDSDVDNPVGTLVVSIFSPPSHASQCQVAGQEILYVPVTNFFGTDTLIYKVKDAAGGSDTATVTITVAPVNDLPVANDDTAVTDEDTAVDIPVLLNDTDVEGDALVVNSIASPPSHGTAATVSATLIRYLPSPNWFGTDAFVYTARDVNGGTDFAVVTVTVIQVNNAPTVNGENIYAFSNTTRVLNLLANDLDVDGDPISISSITQPSHGAAAVIDSAAGTVSYDPEPDYVGTDSFGYHVIDNQGLFAEGSVSITVVLNEGRPYALDDTATTPEDQAKVLDHLLDNDLDADRIDTISSPGNGQAVIGSGQLFITYMPNSHFFGTDVFAYTLANSVGGTDSATVTITVTPVNDAPVAVDDEAVAVAGPVSIDVLSNDSDPADGDTVTLVGIQIPATHGLAAAQPDGSFLYTPVAAFAGTDTFTYRISDGKGGTGAATVSVSVLNTPPGGQVLVTAYDQVSDEASPIRVLFDSVSVAGKTFFVGQLVPPGPPPSGYDALLYFDVSTSAIYGSSGEINTLVVDYGGLSTSSSGLSIYRFDDSADLWIALDTRASSSLANCVECPVDALGVFGLFGKQSSSGGGGGGGGGGCFIATAAYGSPMAGEVNLLRAYRDGYLAHRPWGRALLRAYYTLSPAPAAFVAERPWLRAAARTVLYPIIQTARTSGGDAFPALIGLLMVLGWTMSFMAGLVVIGRKLKRTGRRLSRCVKQNRHEKSINC